VIHRDAPPAAAILPSAEAASFRRTKGRPVVTCWAYPRIRSRASASRTPVDTAMPARRSSARPRPRTRGFGSRVPTTTRPSPAATTARAHGGVRPKWLHGSRVTYRVAPRARAPACASANTSACGPPARRCQPLPTTFPPRTKTAPTGGFGRVRPRPRRASTRASAMKRASASAMKRASASAVKPASAGFSPSERSERGESARRAVKPAPASSRGRGTRASQGSAS